MAAISIHALLAESDARLAAFAQHGAEDFYPRSPCGERRYSLRPPPARGEISIHALLAESDHARVGVAAGAVISIHALLAESDVLRQGLGSWSSYFYPRSPCGERQQFGRLCFQRQPISIHALLAESDLSLRVSIFGSPSFLSTLSLRRATMILLPCAAQATHFYPRSPCGERPVGCLVSMPPWCISIHALLAESDTLPLLTSRLSAAFLSTLSLRRATQSEP